MTTATTATPGEIGPALQIIEEMHPLTESSIIPLLQRLQDSYGYLPRDVVLEVCERTSLPASRVFGVATFYAQFRLEPRGRHVVRCCQGTACHVRGASRVLDEVARQLKVQAGETTKDGLFTVERVNCLGTCALAPVIMLDDDYHHHMTPDKLRKLIGAKRQAVAEAQDAEAD